MNKNISFFVLLALFPFWGWAQKEQKITDLPLVIQPSHNDADKPMVLFLSGDGGWKTFDEELVKEFGQNNLPVVTLNSLHYFWHKKTPKETTDAVVAILSNYMYAWHKKQFILVGYSFGADIVPFIVNRLPNDLMQHCLGIVLFSPGTSTDFEIHLSQMLNSNNQWQYNVVKEIEQMKPYKLLCFMGVEDRVFPDKVLSRPNCQIIHLPTANATAKQNLAGTILTQLQNKN
jgi:type IV secretory pathway VirJ component